MNLMTIFQRYPDQEACMEHLERVRWGDDPHCPQCGSTHVAQSRASQDRPLELRRLPCQLQYREPLRKDQEPLQKWFMAIGSWSMPSVERIHLVLARDLDLNQKSASCSSVSGPRWLRLPCCKACRSGRNLRESPGSATVATMISPVAVGHQLEPVAGGQVSARVATDLSVRSPLSAGWSARHAAEKVRPYTMARKRASPAGGRLCRRIAERIVELIDGHPETLL